MTREKKLVAFSEFALAKLGLRKSPSSVVPVPRMDVTLMVAKVSETEEAAVYELEEVRSTGKFYFNKETGEGGLVNATSSDEELEQFLKGYALVLAEWKESRALPERKAHLDLE